MSETKPAPKVQHVEVRPDFKQRGKFNGNYHETYIDGKLVGYARFMNSEWYAFAFPRNSPQAGTPIAKRDDEITLVANPAYQHAWQRKWDSKEQAQSAIVRAAVQPGYLDAFKRYKATHDQVHMIEVGHKRLVEAVEYLTDSRIVDPSIADPLRTAAQVTLTDTKIDVVEDALYQAMQAREAAKAEWERINAEPPF